MNEDLTFWEAIDMYKKIYKRFEKLEGKPWNSEGAMIELMKQVGELSKYIMVIENYYFPNRKNLPGYSTTKDSIGDELADIIAQVIRIADYYNIDLVEAHIKARNEEDKSLREMNA